MKRGLSYVRSEKQTSTVKKTTAAEESSQFDRAYSEEFGDRLPPRNKDNKFTLADSGNDP